MHERRAELLLTYTKKKERTGEGYQRRAPQGGKKNEEKGRRNRGKRCVEKGGGEAFSVFFRRERKTSEAVREPSQTTRKERRGG